MKHLRPALFSLLALAATSVIASPALAQRHPVVVLTDMSADPDDEQSMTRLLHYANDLDIKGLVATRAVKNGSSTVRKDKILALINAYEVDLPYFRLHDKRFPSASYLRSVTKAGSTRATVGENTEGSNHIYNVVKSALDKNTAPVWILVWGGPRELAQALHKAKSTLSAAQYKNFKRKMRVYSVSHQYEPAVGADIIRKNPDLVYLVSGPLHITNKESRMFRGTYKTLDEQTYLNKSWITKNLWNNHGALARRYPGGVNLNGQRVDHVKEGDTSTFLHLLPLGLNNPMLPDHGGWGGRLRKSKDSQTGLTYWNDIHVADTVMHNGKSVTDRRHAVSRWREAFQQDFAARADWAVKSYANANHAPVARVNGSVARTVSPGATVTLDASPSSDPDGNALSYKWWVYREAGSYSRPVAISNANGKIASFKAPSVDSAKTIHVILEVKDSGSPSLTRYKRVVVTVRP